MSDFPATGWGFFHVADSGPTETFNTDGSPYYHLLDVSESNQILIQTGGTDYGGGTPSNWCGIFRVDDITYEGYADTNGSPH